MMEKPLICKIPQKELGEFVSWLQERFPVYGIKKKNDRLTFEKIEEPDEVVIGGARTTQPILKELFFAPREKVADYFVGENIPQEKEEREKKIIFGVKSCDLKGLLVYDKVFRESSPVDPFYLDRRGEYYIISSDCTTPLSTCFCSFMEINPYPETLFDLNLTPLEDIILLEVGSRWGERVVKEYPTYLAEPKDIEKRKKFRESIVEQVRKVNEGILPLSLPYANLMRVEFNSSVWDEEAKSCVACGGCNAICPTCYCYLLYDEGGEKDYERIRIWDYCQYPSFAQEAGGSNPRRRLTERFRHRYVHKFDYGMVRNGIYECSGCGRCIEVCAGKIDMRKVLKKVEERKVEK
ncbi:4Fe-4S dicluster domain-containing protein [Candidatus Calescamantes bacterium]|nr:4Fe-4S dicluster domain-containing protein [Candidatus Calescamantes bacterium]